jgi:hypothetical protein
MDLILHKKLLTLQAENAMLKEELQKLQELVRPENIKNPERYAGRIAQIAQIAADRTVSQKSGAVEAKKALQSKGVGTDNDTFATWSGSRSGGVRDTSLHGDSAEAEAARTALGKKAVLQPANNAEDRAKADLERKELKDARKGTPALFRGKKIANTRNGRIV